MYADNLKCSDPANPTNAPSCSGVPSKEMDVQSDQKVSVHLIITIQESGAQRLFDQLVYFSVE